MVSRRDDTPPMNKNGYAIINMSVVRYVVSGVAFHGISQAICMTANLFLRETIREVDINK